MHPYILWIPTEGIGSMRAGGRATRHWIVGGGNTLSTRRLYTSFLAVEAIPLRNDRGTDPIRGYCANQRNIILDRD